MILDEFMDGEFIGEGDYAKCYAIATDIVLKVFKRPLPIFRTEIFKYLLNYKNDSFVFPFRLICKGEQFNGYLTKRMFGKALGDVFYSTPLEQMAEHSLKLEKDIDYLSNGLIVTNDLSSNNILYDGKEFKVIDPDFYVHDTRLDIDSAKRTNREIYRSTISGLFVVPFLSREKNAQFIVDRSRHYLAKDINVSEFILQMKEDLEKNYKEKITKVEDLDNILRR